MDLITALAVSIGLLGGIATYLYLTIGLQIWIGFMAWGSFYHCGGGMDGFKKSLTANIWGAICGLVALLLITKISAPLPGVLWPSIAVALTAFVMVLGAKIEAIAAIPAAVYGYASIAGFALLSGGNAASFGLGGPIIGTIVALVLGAVFGLVSEKFAGMLQKK